MNFGSFLFGIVLIGMGFWAGARSSAALGLIGFLPFFCAGVMLCIAAFKKKAPEDDGAGENHHGTQ